jgi:hypothetical protein
VSRIYLEYAPNGDLSQYLSCTVGYATLASSLTKLTPPREQRRRDDYMLPEEVIWRIWECLVKALLVLEKGTEDPNWRREEGTKAPFHHPICHFDIKGGNGK